MGNFKYLNNIGRIDINEDKDIIYSDNGLYLVSPTFVGNHYFEMSGESMYNALLLEEKHCNKNYSKHKLKIIQAIRNRRNICNGFFHHSALDKSMDTQLRSTSAIIRTLILGLNDGYVQKEEISDIVDKHFKFYLNWKNGVWFCHDTSEFFNKGPKTHLKSIYHNKDLKNTLTLNTHFDSLSTLSIALNQSIIDDSSRYISLYSKGVESINNLLYYKNEKSVINIQLEKLHEFFFEKVFSDDKSISYKIYERIIHPLLFKLISPTIFFSNGFINRDLSVMNIHVDYLIVNIVDMLRFLKMYDRIRFDIDVKLERNALIEVIDNAINLIEKNVYIKKYIFNNDIQIAWYVEMHALYSEYNEKYNEVLEELKMNKEYLLENLIFS